MIRINLAGVKVTGSVGLLADGDVGFTPAELQKQALIRILIIVAFPAALWFWEGQVIPAMTIERDQKLGVLEELRSYNGRNARSVQEIKKFKDEEGKLQARIGFLDKLSKDRLREIKVVDLVQQIIPEKVWLSRLEIGNGRMVLSGMAMSDFDISSFMEALAKSVHFVDVNLVSSVENYFDGLNLKKFEIVCIMEKGTP